ncbi:discoidin domain-containing protein [Kribbella solani]|uniref:discoidin domain-containing protein n=1 Tax=Kribbella solani TaxID=236067 RepID=UPI0029AC0C4B|nr:discoidin domain-containing protein [Kribbella solani]MDX3006011.1 discoidin domain-containing protein [Kribbella solani]
MRTSAALLSGVLLAALLPLPANAEPPSVWTHNSSDRLFPYDTRPAQASSTIDLYAARNETEAAQIAIRPTADVQNVSISTTPLTGPGGATLSDITVRREYLHPNVVPIGPGVEIEGTGSKYYDALVENTPRTLAANVTQPYFYSVHVPTGAKPGVYTGSATVKSSAGDTSVPIRITVYPSTLPPTNQSTFRMNNWTTSAGWDYDGTIKAIPLQYGVKMFDANWWRVIEAMARDHAKHRNNVVFADFQALLIPNTTIDTAGNYTFGWESFDRFLKIYKDAGALQWIHTPHLLNGTTDTHGPQLEMLQRAADGSTQMVPVQTGTPEATAYLNKVFAALKQHLDQLGLTDVFYMSANDETWAGADRDAANWMYAIYRKYFPKPLLNEAETNLLDPPATVTADTPRLDLYEDNVGYFQARKQAGNELWLYNCTVPRATYLNRFLMSYLANTRLTPLLAWKTGAVGYLHWGWNYWYDGTNTPIDTFDGAQTGDSFLVRPNKAAYDLYDSIRSEAQLDGIEDFELFTQLAATKPLLAKALANSLLTNSFTSDKSGVAVDTVHRQVLDALASGGADQVYPYADDFSGGSRSWQPKGGNWSVSGGALTQTDTSRWDIVDGLKARAYGDVAASVDLQIRGVNADGGDTNWAGIVIRNLNSTDFGSGYLIAQRNNGEVFVYSSGKTLGHAQLAGYVKGQVTRLRVVARGSKLSVFAGRTPVLTVTDPTFTAGGIGLASGGVNVAFDNVRINPDVNPAEGSKVTTSSSYEQDGWGAQAAVDGQRTSDAASMGWTSDVGTTAQFDLDLGKVRSIGRVDLYPRSDGSNAGAGFPIDYKVEVSADGSAWMTVANRTNQPRPSGVQTVPFAARDARYVRVTGTKLSQDPVGASRMQFAEVEVAGGNLAAGRPVTASTSSKYPNEGWLRANLTDGARQSRLWNTMGWTSESVPAGSAQSVRVDLGGPSVVSKIDLYGRTDGASTGQGFPLDYTVETSTDGTTWTPVASVTGAPQPGAGPVSYSFPERTARYVQVRGTQLRPDGEGGYRMQLSELEVR